MNKHDELAGLLVLVHPNLVYDPADKRNHIGIIASAEPEKNNVMVTFGKDGQALFSTDALLVLKNPNEIHFEAVKDATKMDVRDFKQTLEVSLLASSPLIKDRRLAVEMSRDNPNIHQYSMATLEDELGIRQDYSMGR